MGNVKFALDTGPDANSNSWLKYVRSAPSFEEQNLVACHLTGDQVSDTREWFCWKTHTDTHTHTPGIMWASADIKNKLITEALKHQVWFMHRSTDKNEYIAQQADLNIWWMQFKCKY